VEIHQAQMLLEHKDSTIERLIPQAILSKCQAKEQVSCKDAEIERLRRELDDSRAEVGELKHDLHNVQERLQIKESELDRLLPDAVAARTRRSSVASQRHELNQANQDLDYKNQEIRELRRELENAHAQIGGKQRELLTGRAAELQLKELQQELEHKNSENARLRRELDEQRTECSRYRIELQRLRSEPQINVISRPDVWTPANDDSDLVREAREIQSREASIHRRERVVEQVERQLSSCKSEGYIPFHGGLQPVTLPVRSAPVSRIPTPRRIPEVARAPTPPISPRFYDGNPTITAGPVGRQAGLWDRLGF